MPSPSGPGLVTTDCWPSLVGFFWLSPKFHEYVVGRAVTTTPYVTMFGTQSCPVSVRVPSGLVSNVGVHLSPSWTVALIPTDRAGASVVAADPSYVGTAIV